MWSYGWPFFLWVADVLARHGEHFIGMELSGEVHRWSYGLTLFLEYVRRSGL